MHLRKEVLYYRSEVCYVTTRIHFKEVEHLKINKEVLHLEAGPET
jgi:hypothetical protein